MGRMLLVIMPMMLAIFIRMLIGMDMMLSHSRCSCDKADDEDEEEETKQRLRFSGFCCGCPRCC